MFDVFESGKSSEIPKVGDIMIWDATKDNRHGHVGVVIDIDENYISLANGNAPEVVYQFKYFKSNSNANITIKNIGWQPTYWLQVK